jgi:hypothetical protein
VKNKDLWIETGTDALDETGPKVVGFSRQRGRWVGCPWALLADTCGAIKGPNRAIAALVVQLIYRRTQVCKSRTVTLPTFELKELGIDRYQKARTLGVLQAGGLIRIRNRNGRSTRVTLLWKERRA